MTRTLVPKGRLRWAAVSSSLSNRSPEAVRLPCQAPPYQMALPVSTLITRGAGGGGGAGGGAGRVSTTWCSTGGELFSAPQAAAAATPAATHAACRTLSFAIRPSPAPAASRAPPAPHH